LLVLVGHYWNFRCTLFVFFFALLFLFWVSWFFRVASMCPLSLFFLKLLIPLLNHFFVSHFKQPWFLYYFQLILLDKFNRQHILISLNWFDEFDRYWTFIIDEINFVGVICQFEFTNVTKKVAFVQDKKSLIVHEATVAFLFDYWHGEG
jgi:hypothetical protein